MTNFLKATVVAQLAATCFFGAITAPAPANAGMNCTTNSFTGSTNCNGSGGGSFNSTYNNFTRTSN